MKTGDLPGLEPEMPGNIGGFSIEVAVGNVRQVSKETGNLFRVRVTVKGHQGILRPNSQQLASPRREMEEATSLGSSEAAAGGKRAGASAVEGSSCCQR